ncbi:LysR family transcriptional regulator [Azospirillum picis]|uniref:DNA-binding transcriptional LysR family regulator n=1 Tax=Azospirillum picis TaxID=488438 RepID=A0ABU0MI76_9PROT|nr:LysR family transcriptional regulator [Azospirillum picis]MBP2299219.1 DNA-binding transcriptional LysR family regulator [Azospirillum picis]MDQ0533143.1 DNA-binding transcriptional LysR family regulator [Azospirillum picis]
MNERDENWDDLRHLLSVARHGSLSAAARAMGVNHSTVLRRMTALEKSMGVRLFDKLPGGYVLTAAGDELHRVALKMEEDLAAAARLLSGRDTQIRGSLRVTTIDILTLYVLPRHLAAFRRLHPALRVDVMTAEASLSLTRREADVAIRATAKPPENLIGRAVSGLAFAVYGSVAYLDGAERAGKPSDDPDRHDWVGLDDSFNYTMMAQWVERNVPPDRIGLRVNSVTAVVEAVRAGYGLGLLPCGIADPSPDFRRLGPVVSDGDSRIWLLTHADLRHMGRVRAFMDFMADAFVKDRDLLEGRCGG